MTRGTVRRRAWLLALALLAAAALLPVAAVAHAILLTSSPAAGQRVDATVRGFTLTFDGPVAAALSSIRVLDSAGADHSIGPPTSTAIAPQTLTVRTSPLRRGQFVVAWRALSADSHVVSGAFAIGVRQAPGDVPPALARPPEAGLPQLLAILHIASIASLLIAVGLSVAAIAVPRLHAASASLERGAWIALSTLAIVQFFGQAEALSVAPQRLLDTRTGALRVAITLGGILGVVGLRPGKRPLVAAAALTVVAADVLSGHAATGSHPAIGIVVESVHLFAAAAWIGVLIVALAAPSVAELERIGAIAATSVLALTLTAVPQAWHNIASPSDLRTTEYGGLVCAKAALFVIALAVAAASRRYLRRASPHINASIKIEIALLAALTLVTGVLVDAAPPRSPASVPERRIGGAFAVGDRRIFVEAQPRGDRTYNLKILTTRGGEPTDIDEVRASVRERDRGIGPLAVAVRRLDLGRYTGSFTLPFAGRWLIRVSGRVGDFEERQQSFPLEPTPSGTNLTEL